MFSVKEHKLKEGYVRWNEDHLWVPFLAPVSDRSFCVAQGDYKLRDSFQAQTTKKQ